MAWYKDPETGEIKEVDLFEKNNSDFPSIKSLQSTMLVVPFNVPYKTWQDTYSNLDLHSANNVARKKGVRSLLGEQGVAWLPGNMRINNEFYIETWNRAAVDFFTITAQTKESSPKITKMLTNATKYKEGGAMGFYFDKPATIVQSDPMRSAGMFSYLQEKSPKTSDYYSKEIPFAFNTYDVSFNSKFANKGELLWQAGQSGKFLEGSFKSTIHMPNPKHQYSLNLHVMAEQISIKGSTHSDDNEWNPIIENLKQPTGIQAAGESGKWSTNQGLYMPKDLSHSSYRDATFEIKKPFVEKAYESGVDEGMIGSAPVNIKAHYNFYLLPYEKAISDYDVDQVKVRLEFDSNNLSPIPEPMIPNIYALIYDQISEEKYFRYPDQGSWMPLGAFKHCKKENGSLNFGGFGKQKDGTALTVNNQKFLTEDLGQFLSITTKKNDVNETPVKNIAEYLNSWSSMMGVLNAPQGPDNPVAKKWPGVLWAEPHGHSWSSSAIKTAAMMNKEKKYEFVGISAYKMKDLADEADKLKKMFPFYIDIDLPMANSGMVGKILFENGLTDVFMQNVMAAMYTIGNKETGKEMMDSESLKKFYDKYVLSLSTALKDICIVRKDGTHDPSKNLTPKQDTMFNETLLHLWLNEFLDTDFLLDLDAAPAQTGQKVQHAGFYKDIPAQYYDWVDYKSAADYFNQIMKLKGLTGPQFYSDLHRILKPVVFGKGAPKSSNSPFSLIKWLATKKKINSFINSRVRSVSDVLGGKKAYSEVLFYEVVKYSAIGNSKGGIPGVPYDPQTMGLSGQGDSTPPPESGPDNQHPSGKVSTHIQSFFIPNIPGMDMARYVDTQVKYDKGYYYQVYAHTFVVGTQYQYNNANLNGPFKGDAYKHLDGDFYNLDMNCNYKPDVHLMRVPYYNTIASVNNSVDIPEHTNESFSSNDTSNVKLASLETTLVWDSPPVFPDAVFAPLYGEANRILINCNFNIGEYSLTPISIDKEIVSNGGAHINKLEELTQVKARISQKKLSGPIIFSGDDFCGTLDVLRIDKKPTSYSDFAPTSETRIASVGEGKSNFGFYDNIESNKDYYYIVRERDAHGNYSNPSPVYLARIVHKDGEAPYTIFKMFFMEELENNKPVSTKKFMKYIKIEPSFDQRVFNGLEAGDYDADELLNQVAKLEYLIGELNLSKNVWGRKFKFRFTSKKTGRKFDLNLTVKDIDKIKKEIMSTLGEPDTYSSGKC